MVLPKENLPVTPVKKTKQVKRTRKKAKYNRGLPTKKARRLYRMRNRAKRATKQAQERKEKFMEQLENFWQPLENGLRNSETERDMQMYYFFMCSTLRGLEEIIKNRH